MRYFKIDFGSPAYSVYFKTDKFSEIFCYLDPEFMVYSKQIAEDLGRTTLEITLITEVSESDYNNVIENENTKKIA